MKVIVFWRMFEFIEKFQGCVDFFKFVVENNIFVFFSFKVFWFMDDNFVYCLYEVGVFEDFDYFFFKEFWICIVDFIDVFDVFYNFIIYFEKGIFIKVVIFEGEVIDLVVLFKFLNKIGYDNGVGRIDIVENCFIGFKSRGCYDIFGFIIVYVFVKFD